MVEDYPPNLDAAATLASTTPANGSSGGSTGRDVLLDCRVDRFSCNLRDMVSLLDDLDQHSVVFRSATEPFDTATPKGRMLVQTFGMFAQFERDTIIERVIGGMERKAAKGLWRGGRRPYGYRVNEHSVLVPDYPTRPRPPSSGSSSTSTPRTATAPAPSPTSSTTAATAPPADEPGPDTTSSASSPTASTSVNSPSERSPSTTPTNPSSPKRPSAQPNRLRNRNCHLLVQHPRSSSPAICDGTYPKHGEPDVWDMCQVAPGRKGSRTTASCARHALDASPRGCERIITNQQHPPPDNTLSPTRAVDPSASGRNPASTSRVRAVTDRTNEIRHHQLQTAKSTSPSPAYAGVVLSGQQPLDLGQAPRTRG